MSFKKVVAILGLVAVCGVAAFVGMISYPRILPESWAAPSVSPTVLSAEEVDANCCERVKLGKWQACGCDAEGPPVNAMETR